MTKKLKVGFIGIGSIANFHVPGWNDSPYTEIVAAMDLNPALFPEWQKKYGVSEFFTDPAEIINNPEIDIVDICTPNMVHASLAIAALKAGKHVICEKPLAPTPEEIRQLITARDEAGKLLMTAQHFRFSGPSMAIKAEINLGTLGNIYHARAWMLRRNMLPLAPTFIYKNQSGGGPTIDIGVHILDLSLWLMGHPKPVSVSGVTRTALAHHPGAFSSWGSQTIPADMDVEDFAVAFVRFDTGATLILETSWMLHHNVHPEQMEDNRLWLYGTEGGCEWPQALFMQTDYKNAQLINRSLGLIQNATEPHALECMEFARAIAEGLPSPVPPEQSLDVQLILDAVYKSQAVGHEVAIEHTGR